MSPEDRAAQHQRYLDQRRERRKSSPDKIRAQKAAHYRRNKEANKARGDKWRANNPERVRELARGWLARRRDLKRGGLTAAQTANWARGQKKVCHWCGERCARNYHIDHITPLSRGGKHEVGNLAISCPPCNLKKNARDPIDFAQSIGKLL